MWAAKNFYVSSLAGFARLHSHKKLGTIRNRLLLCCACLPAKLQPARNAGRKTCFRDARETSADLGMHTHSKDIMLGKGLLHITCFLLAMLPANPLPKKTSQFPKPVVQRWSRHLCRGAPRAVEHFKSFVGAAWKNPAHTRESREACTGGRVLGKPKPSDAHFPHAARDEDEYLSN